MENIRIIPESTINYLGLILDRRLVFGKHISHATGKTRKIAAALGKLLPNPEGAKASKRRSYATQCSLYGAPVWYEAMEIERYINMVKSRQRAMPIRISSLSRTISYDALMVISGTIPIYLLAEERKKLHENRNRQAQDHKD